MSFQIEQVIYLIVMRPNAFCIFVRLIGKNVVINLLPPFYQHKKLFSCNNYMIAIILTLWKQIPSYGYMGFMAGDVTSLKTTLCV